MSKAVAGKNAHVCVQLGGVVGTPECGKRMNAAAPNTRVPIATGNSGDRRGLERDQGEA
jgi:hypothetical protein